MLHWVLLGREVDRVYKIQLCILTELFHELVAMALIPGQCLDDVFLKFDLIIFNLNHALSLLFKERVVLQKHLEEIQCLIQLRDVLLFLFDLKLNMLLCHPERKLILLD